MSDEPNTVWSLNDYVECVKELLDNLEVKKPILIGHSFGGRIGPSTTSPVLSPKSLICDCDTYISSGDDR